MKLPATWINWRCWGDYVDAANAAASAAAVLASKTFIVADTEQWKAWEKYSRATRGIGYTTIPRTDPKTNLRVNGHFFDSEWPPPLPAEIKQAA